MYVFACLETMLASITGNLQLGRIFIQNHNLVLLGYFTWSYYDWWSFHFIWWGYYYQYILLSLIAVDFKDQIPVIIILFVTPKCPSLRCTHLTTCPSSCSLVMVLMGTPSIRVCARPLPVFFDPLFPFPFSPFFLGGCHRFEGYSLTQSNMHISEGKPQK